MNTGVPTGRRLRRRLGLVVASGDSGVTLTELIVSMTIMIVVMAMFTTGIIQIYRTVNETESTSIAQSQVNIAFLRLDREIRYASGLSVPLQVGADWYVEYVTTNTGVPVCTELRLNVAAGQLQRRTWVQGATPLVPSAWLPVASNVSSPQPFTLLPADATANFHRLRLALVATSGKGDTAASAETAVTFTALNTSLSTSGTAVCTEGRPIP
jgi:hypothetical protein